MIRDCGDNIVIGTNSPFMASSVSKYIKPHCHKNTKIFDVKTGVLRAIGQYKFDIPQTGIVGVFFTTKSAQNKAHPPALCFPFLLRTGI